jgi:hypothetical protein
LMNAGHSGAWFYPPTSGQGQFIDIEPGNQTMFLSWFTYTDAASLYRCGIGQPDRATLAHRPG